MNPEYIPPFYHPLLTIDLHSRADQGRMGAEEFAEKDHDSLRLFYISPEVYRRFVAIYGVSKDFSHSTLEEFRRIAHGIGGFFEYASIGQDKHSPERNGTLTFHSGASSILGTSENTEMLLKPLSRLVTQAVADGGSLKLRIFSEDEHLDVAQTIDQLIPPTIVHSDLTIETSGQGMEFLVEVGRIA